MPRRWAPPRSSRCAGRPCRAGPKPGLRLAWASAGPPLRVGGQGRPRLRGLARSADLRNCQWDHGALCRWTTSLVWLGPGPDRAWGQVAACALPQCHMRPDIRSARGPRPGSCRVCCSPWWQRGCGARLPKRAAVGYPRACARAHNLETGSDFGVGGADVGEAERGEQLLPLTVRCDGRQLVLSRVRPAH
jgi:hypothetical protein